MSLRERLTTGAPLYGGIISLADAFSAEVMGRAGFDWVCVDLQHGMIGDDALVGILQGLALGSAPALVRVPWNDPAPIMRALDAGADGVVVPMVNSANDASRAVGACRYPPAGIRSWGPTRVALGRSDYSPEGANRESLCAVMIETAEAVHDIDEILAVPGVDIAFVGPSDLAVSLGRRPSLSAEDDLVREAILEVERACRRHQVVPAIFSTGLGPVIRWRDAGFRMVNTGSDRLLMLEAARSFLADVRQHVSTVADTRSSEGRR